MQSARMRGSAGEPIPTVWQALAENDTYFLRGSLVLMAAPPGTAKSILALTLALKSGVPCLYFSADSDAFTQLTRSLCVLTGCSLETASRAVRNGDLKGYEEVLSDIAMRLNYEASPSLSSIETTLEAYEEVYGEYPEVIIIDNASNINQDEDDLENLMDYLHTMSRATQSCVIALHHVTGPYNNGDQPIPRTGVKGQIGRVPEMILTAHMRAGNDYSPHKLCVSTVKNRHGKADPSGYTYAELDFEGSRMRLTDPKLSQDPFALEAA